MKRNKKFLVVPFLIASTVALGACSSGTDSGNASNNSSSSSNSRSAEATPTPLADIANLDGVSTQVAFDAGFVEALGTLGLTPAPVGAADISAEGVATFPITGGNVKYFDPSEDYRPYVQGEILHDGSGLSLTSADGTVVELTDFDIDPGNPAFVSGTVSANGSVVVESARLFDLDGRTLEPLISNADGTAVLTGTTVVLSEDAAALLNETFGTDALTGGIGTGVTVGISTITINTN